MCVTDWSTAARVWQENKPFVVEGSRGARCALSSLQPFDRCTFYIKKIMELLQDCLRL